ncbi:MAG: hypothetical protein WCO65_00130 [bacterium]
MKKTVLSVVVLLTLGIAITSCGSNNEKNNRIPPTPTFSGNADTVNISQNTDVNVSNHTDGFNKAHGVITKSK